MTVLEGTANGRTRLTDEQVRAMRELRQSEQLTHYELAERFGVSQPQAHRICSGQSRKAAGGPIEDPQAGGTQITNVAPWRCSTCRAVIETPQCLACQLSSAKGNR
jgi:hypothetical protein